MPAPFRLPQLLLLAIIALGLGGCSSTKVVDKWRAPDLQEPPAKRILLLSLIKDPVTRAYFEDHFVAAAKKMGVDLVASHTLAPNATDIDERDEIKRLLEKAGADGVLIAQLRGVEKKHKHVPSRLDWYPEMYSHSGFWDYYYMSYRGIYRPGYIGDDDYFKMQFRYFSLASEKLLWAGNLETRNPRSIAGTIEKIAEEVIDELKGSGLL